MYSCCQVSGAVPALPDLPASERWGTRSGQPPGRAPRAGRAQRRPRRGGLSNASATPDKGRAGLSRDVSRGLRSHVCKGLRVSKAPLIPPPSSLPPSGEVPEPHGSRCRGGNPPIATPGHRLGGALLKGRWEAGTSPEIKFPPPPGPPSLFQAPFHTLLWKPQKMSRQWELQGKGLKMSVSQKVNQSRSQQKTEGTFRPG